MPFIKELVIHGFKSFARETHIPFKNTINTIVGPNGSGKSNVTDAVCFVLGRLGSKSMRAKRLGNLIFAGTQDYKPAQEAEVELIFDNTDGGFSLSEKEVSIKRILRKNGQGIYKINGEIKTRQEIIELLAQAGIDANGFNIVLQGEIDSFVKMTPDQRKEVIEEVAGISVYEMRKQKSLQELEKTELRLKEASAILRERTAYLKQLDEERKQALHLKKLEEEVLVIKNSINYKIISEKNEKIETLNSQISKEQDVIAKINELIEKTQSEIAILNEKINNITSNIQKNSGIEQDRLNREISDLRAELAGLGIRKQNAEIQVNDMTNRRQEITENIKKLETEINEASKNKGKSIRKDLEVKKRQLEEIEEAKRKLYVLKSQLQTQNLRVEEKLRQINSLRNKYQETFSKLEEMELELTIKDSLEAHKEKSVLLKSNLEKARKEIEQNLSKRNEHEKEIAVSNREIENENKIKSQVSQIDLCPLCKTKITPDHVTHVINDCDRKIKNNQENSKKLLSEIKVIDEIDDRLRKTISKIEEELKIRSQDILRLELISEKKETLRSLTEEIKQSEKDSQEQIKKKNSLENEISGIKSSESNYDSLRLEVEELMRSNEQSLGMELTVKQRDIERNKAGLKQIERDIEENKQLLQELSSEFEEKRELLENKNEQDGVLKQKFRKVLDEKNQIQEKIHLYERNILQKQNEKHLAEEKVNNLKIERAQFLAQKEAIEQESKILTQGREIRVMRLSVEELRKKLEETQMLIARVGSVNLRALEVYENVKVEYDKVQEKVDIILLEKEEILKVIGDIDKKKRRVFAKTLEELNTLFSRNFSQLSTKGIASLEPVDPEDSLKGGIEMIIKVGKGKYFDTHSLSGGEQSLISLSLIFAIQEYKPYPFYIFDEIDAALDRRNSERLAALLKRYMNKGQYIIVTHNDSLITESPVIYGVSMQEKISKVVSLEV